MFCPNCGAKMPDSGSKFCTKCGASLERDDRQETKLGNEPEPSVEEPKAKHAPNVKIIAIVVAAIAVVAAITIFAVVSCNKPGGEAGSSASSEPAPEPEPNPDPQLTKEEMRDFFVGVWVAQDSTDENMPKSWFESAAAQGIYITLTLWDDGTGVFRTDSGPVKITWEANSATSATVTVEDTDMPIELRGKKLTMKNAEEVELYFVPEDQVDMSNAVDLSNQGQGVTVDPSTITVNEYSKLIGNYSVGFMQIPEHWVNRIDIIDSEFVKSYDAVYYVDTKTEYLAPSTSHYAFAQSVEMSRHSDSYTKLANQLVDSYKSDENYEGTTTAQITVGKRRAILISSTNKTDGQNVMSVVIDRDNDEKVSVVLSFNCGPTSNTKPLEWAKAYMETWQVE